MRQGRVGDRLLHRERPRADRRRSERGAGAAEIVGLSAACSETIYPHIFENADREVGGVLVGRMPADGGLPLVTAAIAALSADEQRATLTFTQQAWAHVHQVLDTEFPADEQIVGWYHSHPGFGIFLSGHDVFIHENFFSAPSQIAVVVDPLACTEGAFAWREGKLQALFERPTPPSWRAPESIAAMRFERSKLEESGAESAEARGGFSARILRPNSWLPPALALAAMLCVLVFLILLLAGVFGSSAGTHGGAGAGTHARVGPRQSGRQAHRPGHQAAGGTEVRGAAP
jgi:proteasome lid subunit RPN8/RPN11